MKVKPSEYKEQLRQVRVGLQQDLCAGQSVMLPNEARILQIPETIGTLECACEALNKALCELESRLSPALSAPPPTGAMQTQPPTENTPLGQKIRTASDSINDAIRFVNSLLCRLEL